MDQQAFIQILNNIYRMIMYKLINKYDGLTNNTIMNLTSILFIDETFTNISMDTLNDITFTQNIKEQIFNLVRSRKISPIIFAFLIIFDFITMNDVPINLRQHITCLVRIFNNPYDPNIIMRHIINYNNNFVLEIEPDPINESLLTRQQTDYTNNNINNYINNNNYINYINNYINNNNLQHQVNLRYGIHNDEDEDEDEDDDEIDTTDCLECMICCDNIGKKNKLDCTTCRKIFHLKCMTRWFRHSDSNACPHCRSII